VGARVVSSPSARRRIETEGVAVTFRSKTLLISGRAAFLILWIAACAERINSISVGRLVADFAHTQVKVKLLDAVPSDVLDRFLGELL
jgi:hypothetical protein